VHDLHFFQVTFAFGTFEFDGESGELRRSGRLVRLEPQPARALELLLSRAGGIVSRDELAAHIWGNDTHVDFNRGLAYCIAEIRRALGDNADNPRFVETLPKRGFRFLAPVESPAAPPAAEAAAVAEPALPAVSTAVLARWRWAAVLATLALALVIGAWAWQDRDFRSRPVIAVSVFDNETGDSRYDLPVRALSDTVVDRLTKLGPQRIGVVGNDAVLRMPRNERDLDQIADQTRAAFVVLAQLQRQGPELSLLIHLIRLDDGTHVWTRRINRPPQDSLDGLDDEAARMVEAAARQFVIRDS
jgi:DNA-binding winged helix-turn-helix (wHTH) protein/TolB-like protein